MTLESISTKIGRFKPDIITHGDNIKCINNLNVCSKITGTSASTPIITGGVLLLCQIYQKMTNSSISQTYIPNYPAPSFWKQLLMESANRIEDKSIYMQGAGVFDIDRSYNYIGVMSNHISLFPNEFDMTSTYFYPLQLQPLFYTGTIMKIPITVLNSISVDTKLINIHISPESVALYVRIKLESLEFNSWGGIITISIEITKQSIDFSGQLNADVKFKFLAVKPYSYQ